MLHNQFIKKQSTSKVFKTR